jgi:hypothetical protein
LLLRGPHSRPPLSRFFETLTCLATGLFSLSNQRGAKSTDTARNTQGLRLLFLLHPARSAHCFFAHRFHCLSLEFELYFSSFFRVPNNEARSLQMRLNERKHFP